MSNATMESETQTQSETQGAAFELLPFSPTPERAPFVSMILRGVCAYDNIFTDFARACDEKCFECERCLTAMRAVSVALSDPASRVWEVWRFDSDATLVGICAVTDVKPGADAKIHVVFFDGDLIGKRDLIDRWIEWLFDDHPDWQGVTRVTMEVPDFAQALARFAHKYLDFGGDYDFMLKKGNTIKVEGVRRAAFRWRGVDRDTLMLGRTR